MPRKSAEDLVKDPSFVSLGSAPEIPVRTALKQLMTTQGDGLELSTRSSPAIARAASIGYIYTTVYASQYVQGRVEQMERLAVSMQGQGRRDLIDTVKAGGRMPDSYYAANGRTPDAMYIREDERWPMSPITGSSMPS